ncbi:MAG: SMI1/KNR4 family protein [Oscillospiraceae bacterium]|nr:SMI1/KNR4 family protein [Oscillospiraceae bacterium]
MSENTVREKFIKIRKMCDRLEEAGVDQYGFYPPVTEADIHRWEEKNNAKLPDGLKEWYLCSDGADITSFQLYPLNRLSADTVIGGYRGYYPVGSYIGDGAMLVADKEGNLYTADHGDINKSDFSGFLDWYLIDFLADELYTYCGDEYESETKQAYNEAIKNAFLKVIGR